MSPATIAKPISGLCADLRPPPRRTTNTPMPTMRKMRRTRADAIAGATSLPLLDAWRADRVACHTSAFETVGWCCSKSTITRERRSASSRARCEGGSRVVTIIDTYDMV